MAEERDLRQGRCAPLHCAQLHADIDFGGDAALPFIAVAQGKSL